jgi:hypothetical protein
MENMWAIIVRRVYANNRQYRTVNKLKEAWANIDEATIQNLIGSMQNRIFKVIARHKGVTDY